MSLGAAATGRLIPRELRRLRALLPARVSIVVEGAAIDAHRAVLGEIGASALRDLPTRRDRPRAIN